jgi:eukaryotic-like serine/threonine-protein kinase
MGLTSSSRIWNDASSPLVTRLARQYEDDWWNSPGRRPEPRDYLPAAPDLRPAALLALQRIDLSLRWGAREQVPVEWYRDRFPELDGEALVALLYEEYCLREEAGESPEAAEYAARFPAVAASFRDVLDIHSLVRPDQAPTSRAPS